MENKVETLEGNEMSGNTTEPTFRKKVRSAMLTVQLSHFKDLENIFAYLEHFKAFRYILACKHDGPTDEHVHIYVQYDNARSLDSRYLHGSHLEAALGSAQKCIAYLKAEDTKHKVAGVKSVVVYENGEAMNKGGALKVSDVRQMDFKDLGEIDARMYRVAKEIIEDKKKLEAVDSWLNDYDIEVIWIVGVSKSGKTTYSKKLGRAERLKGKDVQIMSWSKNGQINKIGPDNAEVLIMNEWRDYKMKFTDFLEVLTNEAINDVKNSSYFNQNLQKIIINTQQWPQDIYTNIKEDRTQIYRRIKKLIVFYPNHEFKSYEDVNPDELEHRKHDYMEQVSENEETTVSELE